jgi:hypothetical protein
MEPVRCSEPNLAGKGGKEHGLRPASAPRAHAGLDSACRASDGSTAPLSPGRPAPTGLCDDIEAGDDALVMRLLGEVGLGVKTAANGIGEALEELRAVLRADYRELPGLPGAVIAQELDRIVEDKIKPCVGTWRLQKHEGFGHLEGFLDRQEIVVHAKPYRRGAGRALWGFSCDTRTRGEGKFVIFLNTAHEPGAVAATIGHELGHYIYNSIGAGESDGQAAMASVLSQHLEEEKELFSDSVVALSAYSRNQADEIRAAANLADRIRSAIAHVAPQYRIDLNRTGLSPFWRVRYLTLLVHFFKLRCALAEAAGI